MKSLNFLFSLLVVSFTLNGQIRNYNIEGEITSPEGRRYAYIFIKEIYEDPPRLICKPILNRKFDITGDIDLKGKLMGTALLFLDTVSNLTADSFSSRLKNGYRNYRPIILEDMVVKIGDINNVDLAIIDGGDLSRDWDKLFEATASGKYEEFIMQNPDSPASLYLIRTLYNIDSKTSIPMPLNFLRLFKSLSERIRRSKEGMDLMLEMSSI